MLASPLSKLLQSARSRDGMTLGVQLTFHGCDYDGESNKGVDLWDMAVRGPRDDKIERLEMLMERLRRLEGRRRFCKEDVEISCRGEVSKEVGWRRCHKELCGPRLLVGAAKRQGRQEG